MVWFQVDIPLTLGCLLMAAVLDLRAFKMGLLVAGIALMFSSIGVMVFGAKLGMVAANAVPVLSIMVWLASVLSVVRRWLRPKRPGEVTDRIRSEFHANRMISDPARSTLYGVALGEAGWSGPVQLVRLNEQDGRVPLVPTFEAGILQIALEPFINIQSASAESAQQHDKLAISGTPAAGPDLTGPANIHTTSMQSPYE